MFREDFWADAPEARGAPVSGLNDNEGYGLVGGWGTRSADEMPQPPYPDIELAEGFCGDRSADRCMVCDILVGRRDDTGSWISKVYVKVSGVYAVYRTGHSVGVHYADDAARADEQRKAIVPLNDIRMQIDGLLDDWRRSEQFKDRVSAFDGRVAAALQLCLEGDGTAALTSLTAVRDAIREERATLGRLQYLLSALLYSGAVIALAAEICSRTAVEPLVHYIGLAIIGGASGAFFSIATARRTKLTDIRRRENIGNAILRVTAGLIAACVLVLQMRAKIFAGIELGGVMFSGATLSTEGVLLIGFFGGFLERLLPDFLSKAAPAPCEALQ